MQLRILGPLEVMGRTGPVPLRGLERKGLLAYLTLHRGRLVPAARLAEEVWGDDGATRAVHGSARRLREVLDGCDGVVLEAVEDGYRLQIADDALDSARFEAAVAAARSETDPDLRARLLDEAGALWRGRPLDGLPWRWAAEERTRLERLRTDLRDQPAPTPPPRRRRSDREPARPTGVVTFLLTDIVGSTTLWELEPVAMDEALTRHDEIARAAVAAHGGHLLKARGEGDSTFSVFARATDAVLAARDLLDGLEDERWPTRAPLTVRASVHTGEAVERDGDYFGPTVNRAARLRAVARPGQVVVSEPTSQVVRHHLPPGLVLEPLGPRSLRGSRHAEVVHLLGAHVPEPVGEVAARVGADRPLGVDRSTGVGADPATPGPARVTEGRGPDGARPGARRGAPLADVPQHVAVRRGELDVLLARWREVLDGATRLVLVGGEPGIGKSTLLASAAGALAAQGALVLAGRCDEDYDVPFQPFVEALDQLLEVPAGARAVHLEGGLDAELARLLPRLADVATDRPCPRADDPQTSRYRLFEAVTAWLGATAREQPVALLVEDLHWAAPDTLLLLRHVARAPSGVLLVGTYRHTEATPGSPLADLCARVAEEPWASELRLSGLTVDEVATIVERRFAGSGVEPPAASRVHDRTRGNPLFVREVLSSILESDGSEGGTADDEGTWLSARTQEVVLGRIRRLGPRCRQVLEVAAVLGAEPRLRALLSLTEADMGTEACLDALDDAITAGLVVESGPEPGAHRFVHDLVRDAVLGSMGRHRRRRLHLEAGRYLEREGSAADLGQLAHHFGAALPLAPAEAAAHGRRAAERSMAAAAYEEAAVLYERALAASRLATPDPAPEHCELLLDLARAQVGAGHVGAATEVVEEAADLARRLHLPRHLARAALCFEGEIITGGPFWHRRQELLEEAWAGLPEGADPLRVRVMAMLAHVRASLEPGPACASLAEAALDLARHAGDEAALAAALQARRQSMARPERAQERLGLSVRVIAHGRAADNPTWAMHGRHTLLADLLELGRLDDFDRELEVYAGEAHRLRRPHDLWRVGVMRATRALFRGAIGEGEELSHRAYEVGESLEQPGAMQALVVQAFFVAWQRGAAGALAPQAAEWNAQHPGVATWRAALALALAEAGERDAAVEELHAMGRDDFSGLADDNLWLPALGMAAEVAWRTGDRVTAPALHRLLVPHAASNVAIGTVLALGSASRATGLAAALAGDLDAAVDRLEAAVAHGAEMGSLLWAAVSRGDLVAVLRRRDGPGDRSRWEAEQARLAAEREELTALGGTPR